VLLLGSGCGGREASEDRAISRDLGLIQNGTLIVGSEIPYPPFEEGDPPDYEGFDIDLINAIAEKLDLETQIKDATVSSILQGEGGNFDLSISAVEITPAREKRVNFSSPYYVDSLSLLIRDDSGIETMSDITDGMILGVEDGTSGETYAGRGTEASEVRAFASPGEAIAALANSEVNAVIASPQVAEEAVETREGLVIADTFPTGEEYGIVVPKGKDELLGAVNSALQELKEEGAISGLYEEYFGIEAPAQLAPAIDES
jgi:polar amino acid transport system substrate-binding protein